MRKSFEQLNYLERYRNEGTKTYSQHADYTEAQDRFQPRAQVPSFELPCFKIAHDSAHIYTANPSPELSAIYIDQEHVLFCVHPQVLAELNTDPYVVEIRRTGHSCAPFKVTPSSSTRTLLVLGMTPEHALKVHFPFRISRYGRKMRDEVIEQAINVSREIEAGIGVFDRRFAFLREVIGVAHKNLSPESTRGENWGYLVRDMQPFPKVDEDRQLVPGFALYGSDLLKREKVPLLFELIDQADPCGDILENIMLPIIRHWITCFQHFGFLLEPHGQNTLFEIDRDRRIRRVVHRDLSVGIDMRRRRELKRADDSINGYNRMETRPLSQHNLRQIHRQPFL
jgi:siderophore synthetase component